MSRVTASRPGARIEEKCKAQPDPRLTRARALQVRPQAKRLDLVVLLVRVKRADPGARRRPATPGQDF